MEQLHAPYPVAWSIWCRFPLHFLHDEYWRLKWYLYSDKATTWNKNESVALNKKKKKVCSVSPFCPQLQYHLATGRHATWRPVGRLAPHHRIQRTQSSLRIWRDAFLFKVNPPFMASQSTGAHLGEKMNPPPKTVWSNEVASHDSFHYSWWWHSMPKEAHWEKKKKKKMTQRL